MNKKKKKEKVVKSLDGKELAWWVMYNVELTCIDPFSRLPSLFYSIHPPSGIYPPFSLHEKKKKEKFPFYPPN